MTTYDEDWFRSRCKIDPITGCWRWQGAHTQGYGWMNNSDFHGGVHRWAYICLIGFPSGQIDHVKSRGCIHRDCCNIAHLEDVTRRVNIRRGDGACATNGRKTHCPSGHEYTTANTWINAKGGRVCKTCERIKSRLKARKRRERLGQVPRPGTWLAENAVRVDAKDFLA